MKYSLIFLASAVFATVQCTGGQQLLGSIGLLDNTYQCQNGANPSLECVDSSAPPKCSCTCSNGIMFNQTLMGTSPTGSGTSPDTCQADKDRCLQRESELSAQITDAQQARKECEEKSITDINQALEAHMKREQELLAQLAQAQKKPYTYNGCYVSTESARPLVNLRNQHVSMTYEMCTDLCKKYRWFGLQDRTLCFCGNELRLHKLGQGEECTLSCAGDRTQVCGGNSRMSVFYHDTVTAS